MKQEFTIVDDFGRKTVFTGEQLVDDHSDTAEARKPTWIEITVWRTEAGNFVVRRKNNYRVVHASDQCVKSDGYVLRPSTANDTFGCSECNRNAQPGWGQESRISVDVYTKAQALIDSFQQGGHHSHLSRAILSDLARLDQRIDAAWSVVHVA